MAVTFKYDTQSFTETDTISFSVTIVDPCLATVVNDAVFTPATLNVVNGATGTMTFNEVTDSVEVANNINTLCQQRAYSLFMNDQTTAASFITLSGTAPGPYTITAKPTLDAHVGTWTFKLKTVLSQYPSNPN